MKYHLIENENKELMKLSLRLRTFSSHATVMYAKGTDYSILEVGRPPPPHAAVRAGLRRRWVQKVDRFRMRGRWNVALA